MTKRVLLAGGGHAHLGVLAAFERAPPKNCEITLLSPFPHQIYSGMLPGCVAGHYSLDECVIPLPQLADRAGARFSLGHVARIDLDARIAFTEGAAALAFDLISIDIGSVIDPSAIAGLAEHAIALRPFESLIGSWERLLAHLADSSDAHTLTVVGGGAGGAEIALAAAFRAASSRLPLRVQIVTGRNGVVPTLPVSAQRKLERILHATDIRLVVDDAVEIGRHTVMLADGGELNSDATIVATGAAPAEWPRESGLACDDAGFIAVNEHLQSISHPFVFAAGDCATMLAHPRPRSGVYAVRAGPPLARNLGLALTGRGLARYAPQRRALYLLSAGARYALATWGSLCAEGAWVWRWKNRIDRRFVASLRRDHLEGKTA